MTHIEPPIGTGDMAPPAPDEADLIRLAEACGVGHWRLDLAANVCHLSPIARELLWLQPEAGIVPARVFLDLLQGQSVRPTELANAVFAAELSLNGEFKISNAVDGQVRWLALRCSTLTPTLGEVATVAGLCFDVSDRHREMETKDLINQEIGHRMKNLLSVVGSLVTLSGEHHPEARQFIVAFQSRLSSLAATHALLVGSDWQPIPFRGLIGKVLEPLGVAHRVRLAGSINILVGSHDAHTLALALHELATNAIKYGALSNGTGYVKLTASVESHVGSEALLLTWEERDGPAVEAPKGKGFGLSLLRRLTRRQEQPETFLQWRVSGLVCSLSFGLTSKEESH